MAQSIFGGCTSYQGQSFDDISEDIKGWIKYAENMSNELEEKIKISKENHYWDKVGFDFKSTIYESISYFKTIICDLTLISDAISQDKVTKREVGLLQKIGMRAVEFNTVDYPASYKGRDAHLWKDYGNPDFKNIEDMYAHGRDFFVTLQDAANAATRLEDYMNESKTINNTMNISGNITNSQIQQGTNYSTQFQECGENFDYDNVLKIVEQIQQYTSLEQFKTELGEKADEIIQELDSIKENANQKKRSDVIKRSFEKIKDIASNVGTKIISGGIITLINETFPNL